MTDVQLAPMREEVYVRQPYEQTNTMGMPVEPVPVQHGVGGVGMGYDRAALEAAELAAFEKGRMQGEMEAIRRAEAEGPLMKTMAPTGAELAAQQAVLNAPDVIEINRLTWIQRAAAVLGELCTFGTVALTLVWVLNWRGDLSWDNSRNNGNHEMLNAGLVAFALGLFFNAQAISNYRLLPLHTNAHINRAWYIVMQLCAITCYIVALAAVIMTFPLGETTFWSMTDWCFILALAVYLPHAFYSMARSVMDAVWPVDYETWAEVNNKIDYGRDHHLDAMHRANAAVNHGVDRRTVYTPAPHSIRHGKHLPATNANVGAEVPAAPANAPRWAEIPRTHSNDYFLLPRAKWANVAFWAMGATFLMYVASQQHLQAAGAGAWAQDARPVGERGITGPIDEDGAQSHLIGVLGLVTLAMLTFMSYASMPPRTTLVKNGAAVAPGQLDINDPRRGSISHNAETIV